MNQQAVALAADSAATVSGAKIFAADKIFGLSKYEPVAAMVYGHASLMFVPWETLIKVYRTDLAKQSFKTLDEYAVHFLKFLGSHRGLVPKQQQEMFALLSAHRQFERVRDSIVKRVDQASNAGPVDEKAARRIVREVVGETHSRFGSLKTRRKLPANFRKRLRETYGTEITQAMDAAFEKLSLTKKLREQLVSIALDLWCKDGIRGDSGIVFAGYGRDDIFPRLAWYELDGVLLDHPIHWRRGRTQITHFERAFVQGFAQIDMIHLFMEGVTPAYERFVENYVDEVIDRYGEVALHALPERQRTKRVRDALQAARSDMRSGIGDEFRKHRNELYAEPVLQIVESLPKDELAALAESLVNLTSLKKRISLDDETVGGPIDVAVISRGDGLIWVKRKHYFDPALNQHFFANYYS